MLRLTSFVMHYFVFSFMFADTPEFWCYGKGISEQRYAKYIESECISIYQILSNQQWLLQWPPFNALFGYVNR